MTFELCYVELILEQLIFCWSSSLIVLGSSEWVQTFDAVDGKQARRTNSSSPLGELFDHGDFSPPFSFIYSYIILSLS